ncbi:hypothetical protein F4802DRAFT_573260 [Xylaria palmicola]|nr:hypothetical protein F4802DRAFT_573260 [Xylaria palmicola]
MPPPDPVAAAPRAEDAPPQPDEDDEDELSVTSTNAGDNDTEKEWEVDDILAARPHPDRPDALLYFIKWEGFGLEHCTWEPIEHLGDGLLDKWEENKAEIAAGTRPMFDMALYDAACAARARRHMRRNAKRQKCGLPLTPPFPPGYGDGTYAPSDRDSSSSEEAARETLEIDTANIPSSKPKATASGSTSSVAARKPTPPAHRVAKQRTFSGTPSSVFQKGSNTSRIADKGRDLRPSPTVPKTSASNHPSSTTSGSLSKGIGGTMTGYQGTARRSSVFKSSIIKTSTQNASAATRKPTLTATGSPTVPVKPVNSSTAKRLTATRSRQAPARSGTNIFAGGTQPKKRANLSETMDDPTKTPKHFSNLRLLNLAKKRGAEKADTAGALSSIPSKFIIGNEEPNIPARKPSLVSPTTAVSPQSSEASHALSPALEATSKSSVPVGSARQESTGRHTEEASTLKRKKSVRFTGEDNDEFATPTNDVFDDITDRPTGINNPDVDKKMPGHSQKVLLAAYQERGHTQNITKLVKFGSSEVIEVSFSGIVRHHASWLAAFKNIEILHLRTTCTSFHFFTQSQQLIGERLSSGALEDILPHHAAALRNVASSLQRSSIGLHLVAREFSILVYPAECDGWAWLEKDVKKPDPDTLLRHLIFRSSIPSQIYPSQFHKDPKMFSQLIHPNGVNDPELVGALTGLDFSKLLPQDLRFKDKQVYMLLIPLKARQLLGVIMAWLRCHQPDRPIFTVEQPNSWRLFHELVQAGAGGTIIMHADITLWKLEKIPSLWRMLEVQKYTFWNLDTGENERPQYPSDLEATSVPGTLQLTRLFPYGRAFLITPSFAISEPAKLCAFLKWFLSYAPNPAHIIVTCNDFARFLRNITEEKEREHNNLISINPDNRDVYTFLERVGRSQQDIDDHFRAWELFQEILDLFGDEETSEDIRKIHYLNEFIDPSDEQSLVNAFCWWTQLKCDRFRRFYVLGSDPSKMQRAYRYIDIPRYFDTESSDPDIAGIISQRQTCAAELQKEANKQGTEVNIAWAAGGSVGEWRTSVCETPFSFPGALFKTDSIQELQRWVDQYRKWTVNNWCQLHERPVAWRDYDMAVQFDDRGGYSRNFDTFNDWIKAAPKFTSKRNTWLGLFYTITDTWDEYMPKRRYERHPWIAVFRPKNPHYLVTARSFPSLELFIWDKAISEREKFEYGLLDMQCQLIDFVYERVPHLYPGCTLSDVWYSSAAIEPAGLSDNPLDITCRRMAELFENSRDELPPTEITLHTKWTPVDRRLWTAGMSSMTVRSKLAARPHELALKRFPQTEEDELKPQRMIWHPVQRGVRGRGTKCLNDLFEACWKARSHDPACTYVRYQYTPTQRWWAHQVEEGRDYGYVWVGVAGKIIDRLPGVE